MEAGGADAQGYIAKPSQLTESDASCPKAGQQETLFTGQVGAGPPLCPNPSSSPASSSGPNLPRLIRCPPDPRFSSDPCPHVPSACYPPPLSSKPLPTFSFFSSSTAHPFYLALSPLDPYLSRLHLPSAFSPLSPKVQGPPLSINPHPDRKPSPAQRKLLLLRFPPIYPLLTPM